MYIEKRSVTDAIEKGLPAYIQNMLWYLLELKEEFHYFDLSVAPDDKGKPMQKIIHRIPSCQDEYAYHDKNFVESNIVVKADISGHIMMFTNEMHPRSKNS